MNHVTFIGRLVRDNQLKTVNSAHTVINNVLAVARNYRNKDGTYPTDFIPIVVWDKLAEILHKHTVKGQRIAISGSMHSRNYTNSDNETVYLIECVVTEIILLDKPNTPKEDTIQFTGEV